MARGGKMGEVVQIDSKGRIVIPRPIRNRLGLREGTQVLVEATGEEIVLSRVQIQPAKEGPQELKSFLRNSPKL
jgi:AbrB family looped-hinge helix DNA binding protein